MSAGARGGGATAPADVAALRARAVTRRFGSFIAVEDVTMRVAPGEIVGLLGANGAGKTTLIRMLLGLLATSSGEIQVLGGRPDRSRRRRLGYVPQNLGLYRDLTIAENLAFIAGVYGVPAPRPPDDLLPFADAQIRSLSLGIARRAAFVAALAHQPQVLLADEPTSGVDALTSAGLWDTIHDQADRDVAVLVTTHNMQEAHQCDRLLLMAGGRLVAQGSVRDIVGDTAASAVRTDDWSAAFAALNAAGIPVMLDGRAVRVADTAPEAVERVLRAAGIRASVEPVPATIEERMLVLARS
ncbi:MAG: ABC transporter ATP-binding protein [Actinomycetia bacterium]|nr:ABC transporter ATP-binding protein [Actinomycetes bacterium]